MVFWRELPEIASIYCSGSEPSARSSKGPNGSACAATPAARIAASPSHARRQSLSLADANIARAAVAQPARSERAAGLQIEIYAVKNTLPVDPEGAGKLGLASLTTG
jgi:hypothetical protein